MRIEWSTLIFQTVNFAVLAWLLQRFLYRPVLRMIDARRAAIEQQFANAAQARTQAQQQMAAIEADRGGIASERNEALKAAAAEAEKAAGARRAAVQREATALLEATRKTLASDRAEALAEARRVALELGEQMAGRLLADIPVKQRTDMWLERIAENLSGLPQQSRDGLTQQIAEAAALRVVTASALSPEETDSWRARLQSSLARAIVISFDVDEHLIAGADLYFPHAILRFSWRSALEAMRAQTDFRADAR